MPLLWTNLLTKLETRSNNSYCDEPNLYFNSFNNQLIKRFAIIKTFCLYLILSMVQGGLGAPIPDVAEENKQFPKGFFDGMCLLPTFYQPETESLRWATHNNIRKTLFFSVFRNIKQAEYKNLKDEENDSFELIEPIENSQHEGWVDWFIETYYSKEKQSGKLLQIQIWKTQRFIAGKESVGKYTVKFYQMDDDEFKGKIYPHSPIDAARYLWFSRRHFRIL